MSLPTTQISTIIMDTGKVLIGRATDAKWELPTATIQPFVTSQDTSITSVFELTGLTINPQSNVFVSEDINKDTDVHRVLIYLYATYVSGDLKPSSGWDEAEWVDVRELAKYQEDMSPATIDAFYKFSLVLRQAASRADS